MEARDCPSRSADADLLNRQKRFLFFIPTPPTSPAQGGKVTSSDNRTSEDLLFSCSTSSCPACSGIFSRHTRCRSGVPLTIQSYSRRTGLVLISLRHTSFQASRHRICPLTQCLKPHITASHSFPAELNLISLCSGI